VLEDCPSHPRRPGSAGVGTAEHPERRKSSLGLTPQQAASMPSRRDIVRRLLADAVAAVGDAAAAAVGTGDQTLVSIAVRLARRPHEAGTAGPAAGLAQHRAPPPDSTPDSETGEKWQRPETYRVGPLPKARVGKRVSDRRSAEAFAGHQLADALTRIEHPGL